MVRWRSLDSPVLLLSCHFYLSFNIWSPVSESNGPPDAYKATALPNELTGHFITLFIVEAEMEMGL